MRLAAIAVVVGLSAAGAIAQTTQPSPSEPTPAEAWVGTWSGKVKWKECSLETTDTLAMPIAALNSQLTSDGDLLYEGLGAVVWSASGKQLVVTREGIELSLTPAKKGAAKLKMTTESGCIATATLKRATSGMPSCDAVRALATVKSTCDSLDEGVRDDELVTVDGAWKGWKKLKGKKKKAQAKRCTAQLPALRTDVASCAPTGGGTIVAGGGCAGFLAALDVIVNCASAPPELREAIKSALGQLEQFKSMLTDELCNEQIDSLRLQMTQIGCPF